MSRGRSLNFPERKPPAPTEGRHDLTSPPRLCRMIAGFGKIVAGTCAMIDINVSVATTQLSVVDDCSKGWNHTLRKLLVEPACQSEKKTQIGGTKTSISATYPGLCLTDWPTVNRAPEIEACSKPRSHPDNSYSRRIISGTSATSVAAKFSLFALNKMRARRSNKKSCWMQAMC
jgi:hypothetical protein